MLPCMKPKNRALAITFSPQINIRGNLPIFTAKKRALS
jgi:hypothetical protein